MYRWVIWKVIQEEGTRESREGETGKKHELPRPTLWTTGINPRVSWEPCICQLGLSPCRKEVEASVYWLPYPLGFRLCPEVLTLPSPVCASTPSGHPQHQNQVREQVQGSHHKRYLRHTDHPSKLCLKMKVAHEAVAQRAGVPMPSTEPGSPESHQQWWWWWVSRSSSFFR